MFSVLLLLFASVICMSAHLSRLYFGSKQVKNWATSFVGAAAADSVPHLDSRPVLWLILSTGGCKERGGKQEQEINREIYVLILVGKQHNTTGVVIESTIMFIGFVQLAIIFTVGQWCKTYRKILIYNMRWRFSSHSLTQTSTHACEKLEKKRFYVTSSVLSSVRSFFPQPVSW